jgi:CheY-like chemotaxis protein
MTKILLVEDDPLIYRLYQKTFNLEGFEVELAEDGNVALEKLKTFTPEIILLDIMMPNMNGLEFLSKIKNDPATGHVPVIVLTNMSDMNIINMATARGAALCIIKSRSEPEEVVNAVKGLLAQQGQSDASAPAESPENPNPTSS